MTRGGREKTKAARLANVLKGLPAKLPSAGGKSKKKGTRPAPKA